MEITEVNKKKVFNDSLCHNIPELNATHNAKLL